MSLFFPTLVFADNIDTKNAQTQLILYAIARHADSEDGTCFPKPTTLAKMAKCSERTARRHVAHLKAQGVITLEPRYAENGRQTTSLITLVGYAEWRGKHPTRSIPPISDEEEVGGQIDQVPPKMARGGGQHVSGGGGQQLARGGGQQGGHPLTDILTDNRTDILTNTPPLTPPLDDRATSADAWEASPPPPSKSSEVKWASDQIESPSTPVVSRESGVTGPVRVVTNAGDAARQVVGAAVSTADWVKVWRLNDEKNFNDWCGWMEANGYGQVVSARTRGFVFVPTPELDDGIELFRRKFPLAKPAQVGNTALSASGRV